MTAYRETSPLTEATVLLQRLAAAKQARSELEAELERKLRPQRFRRRLGAAIAMLTLGAVTTAAWQYEPHRTATVIVPVRGACHDAYTPLEIVVAECEDTEGPILPGARSPAHRGFAFELPAGKTCTFYLAYENGDGSVQVEKQVGTSRSFLPAGTSAYTLPAVQDQEDTCDLRRK
jgi:hypothetical protein